MGINRKIIDDLITPITRIIYSQNAEFGGFAGLTSLLGVYNGSMYSLEDGNELLPRKLLEASGSKVELESKVNYIEKKSNGRFQVLIGENSSVFDGIIVAAPLEGANIKFDGVPKQKYQERKYQKIYIKLLKGVVNLKYFNLDTSSKLPSVILTSKEADPITRFSINKSTKNESWMTITSTEPIGNDFVDEVLKKRRTFLDHTWSAAYPFFKPIQKIPPISIDNGLLYLNAIESATSSLETSTFAALQSIKIIKKQIIS